MMKYWQHDVRKEIQKKYPRASFSVLLMLGYTANVNFTIAGVFFTFSLYENNWIHEGNQAF